MYTEIFKYTFANVFKLLISLYSKIYFQQSFRFFSSLSIHNRPYLITQRSRQRSDPATPTKVRRKSSVKDPLIEAKLSSNSEPVAVDELDGAIMTPEVFSPHAAHHYQHMRPLLEDPQQLMHPLLSQSKFYLE